MKKLGRDIVLDCAKVLNVILVTLPFALCWFGYYAERIAAPFYGRGNWLLARDPIKTCVNDKKRQYENHRLSQEWK